MPHEMMIPALGGAAGWTIDGNLYLHRKKITIANTNVAANLTDFPLLVPIAGDTDIGAICQADGRDLRFALADGTLLDSERENFAVAAGAASGNIWTKVPTIYTAANTDVYCYFGNGAAAAQATPASVWDANFKGVWHLKETGTNPTAYDSTANANNSNSQTWAPTSGQISGAGSFNGSSNRIQSPDTASLSITGNVSIGVWVKPTSLPASGAFMCLVNKYDGGANLGGYDLRLFNNAGTQRVGLTTQAPPGTGGGGDVAATLSTSAWSLVSAVYDGSNSKIYVNGAYVGQVANTVNPANNTKLFNIGNFGYYTPTSGELGRYFSGLLDEVRLSSAARSAAWIGFEYKNQIGSNELTWGALE